MTANDCANQRFLIVDDIKQSMDTLKLFSYKLGAVHVDTCYNSKNVISMCEAVSYDVIFLGYDLGDHKKNGQQILEELRIKQVVKRLAIIIMVTGEVSQAMVLAALEHKPDDYLTKPYTQKDLATRLKRSWDKKVAMEAIYRAMDEQDNSKVLDLCNKEIQRNSPYKTECLGIKSRQYFYLNQYIEATEIYELCKSIKNCQWARIGLGKIALISDDYPTAKVHFKTIIEQYPYYLSAYDWLAKTYDLNKEPRLALETLEIAITMSPRSVARLLQYADLCLSYEQYDKATSALLVTNDLADNSIHYKPENALLFAESLLQHFDELSSKEKKKFHSKVSIAIQKVNKDFTSSELGIRSKLLSARLFNKSKQFIEGTNLLQQAEQLLEKSMSEISACGFLEIAKSFNELQRQDRAAHILSDLSRNNPTDSELQSKIEILRSKTPTSREKTQAQRAFSRGVNYFSIHKYSLAINEFSKALIHNPRYTAAKLHLLEALLVFAETGNEKQLELNRSHDIIKDLSKMKAYEEGFDMFIKLKEKFSQVQNTC
ncbi:MAG: CheY-like chemotaxis protein [Alteromonadaceae bacterium]|jgi:CheY-like chemotaxis protein